MKQYDIPPYEQYYRVRVGYDVSWGTFFAQVEDLRIPVPERREGPTHWLTGATSVAKVREFLAPFAALPPDVGEQIEYDRKNGQYRRDDRLRRAR